MRTDELLTHLAMARSDEAASPAEAIDRVAVRQLRGAIRTDIGDAA